MKQTYINTLCAASLITVFFFVSQSIQAQSKSESNHAKEILPEQHLKSQIIGNKRVEVETGIARAVYSPGIKVSKAEPKIMAEQYLLVNAPTLMLKAQTNDIVHQRTIETPGGYKVHFVQKVEGYPVYGSTINVSINRQDIILPKIQTMC